ncbi:MAG: hypothetical protein GTN78_18830 [Gemmatimonadales bacterium]|nr:hypothetical protein [Gemmatimonadales bacterium]NIN12932.1 hypothetical protein [Gemmatimonadales bacterium]NIR02220.1 hypothetical protein [Gemmatimonadales bacterium]NIS66012.1 hypothetical protein [Gemmatimonadales bacterium]
MYLHTPITVAVIAIPALLGLVLPAAQAQEPAVPCEKNAAYRQFGFWIGEWDMFNSEGRLVGTNRIEKLLNGCLLLEHWTSARGGEGNSIN